MRAEPHLIKANKINKTIVTAVIIVVRLLNKTQNFISICSICLQNKIAVRFASIAAVIVYRSSNINTALDTFHKVTQLPSSELSLIDT